MHFDLETLEGLAKLMASESSDPSDIRGLRARAVAGAVAEIKRLRKALDIAVSRGCDHCSESIKAARAVANN